MSAKKIWVTWLPGDNNQKELHATIEALQAVGLQVNGSPWIDDLEKSVWTELADMLCGDEAPDLWLLTGRVEDFTNPRIRYALSMISSNLLERKAQAKIFVQCIDAENPDDLPLLSAHWQTMDTTAGWNAKMVAAAFSSAPPSPQHDFHFTVIAHSHIGQWYEVGPAKGQVAWKGAMFGLTGEGAEIAFQAVGKRGQLPEKSVNEYAQNGIEAEIGGDTFTACALQNVITDEDAYFIKVKGAPEKIMFGGHPGTDQAEVNLIDLI